MNRSDSDSMQTGILARCAPLFHIVVIASLLSSCDGGLFGTGDGGELIEVSDSPGQQASGSSDTQPSDITSAMTPDSAPEMSVDSMTGEQITSVAFSNTTPGGLDPLSTMLPVVKLVNLTELRVTLATIDTDNTISASAQNTTGLLQVNIGESILDIRTLDDDLPLAVINPLNAAEDSLTTLVISPDRSDNSITGPADSFSVSVLALDTRATVSAAGMAEIRIVTVQFANDENSPSRYSLTPTGDDTTGSELVLSTANNSSAGMYSLANSGDYILSSDDESFLPIALRLEANELYTIIVTDNQQTPVYTEVDSLSDE